MHYHNSIGDATISPGGSVALVGHPNVGKSVLFQKMTGQYVTVSNYPGTTVEVSRSAALNLPETTLVDTPGVLTFPPHTEDERVTARVLFEENLRAIVQVGDAKNIRRTLLLTVQLAEMGVPLVLALNMMDEAQQRGVQVDHALLSESLSLPVIPTTAVRGEGIDQLKERLKNTAPASLHISYPKDIEDALAEVESHLTETPIEPRALALLWLSGDDTAASWLRGHVDGDRLEELKKIRRQLGRVFDTPLPAVIQNARLAYVDQLADRVEVEAGQRGRGPAAKLGRLAAHPVWGLPIMGLVLYALYWFVGFFGAQVLVDFLELTVFEGALNPVVSGVVERLIPIPFIADLLIGKYGLWTMGMTYALALILPIVTTFFLAFGIMEDSGYLPRVAVLTNRTFRSLGLNGKAVMPMILGLGCVTMATLTTRVMENKRERFLVTLLLALGVPCSAQLGVVMGMLAGISLTATLIWAGVVLLIMLAVGWLAARLVPGERSPLMVELPPLRWPVFSNVITKTLARLEWYLKEVIPLFLLGTAAMFLLDKAGVLQALIRAGEPLVKNRLGLPAEASAAFLMGFLRRDFGATGLFIMESQGLLSPVQVVVGMVTITLFVPCIASVLMIAKERDWKTAAGMLALIFPLAFLVGGLLYRFFLATGITL
ncbi:MAG: ferrous iron transport protein B [Anaerolineales bacterium]